MKSTVRPPRIVFVWVGRERDSPLDAVTLDFVARISRSFPAEVRRVRPEGGDDARSIRSESDRLAEAVRGAGALWLCDREGTSLDSVRLEKWLSADLENVPAPIAIVIGGAGGVDDRLRSLASRRLSFSPMTFPHAVARLLAAEQLYRALTLRERVPYHK